MRIDALLAACLTRVALPRLLVRGRLLLFRRRLLPDTRTAEQILAGEDDAEEAFDPASNEVCRIDDAKKKPAYDAWLYMADSGTVFRAGTTEVVADVIQFGVECADKPLGLALSGVLHGESRG